MDKNIKYIIEKNINFNPVDYQDEIQDLVDRQTISNISYKYFPKTRKQLEKIIIEKLTENIECPYLNDINTSEITDMSNLFNSNPDEYLAQAGINIVYRLKQLDLSKWITSNVTDMTRMFYMCISLEELNISDWDTSNVTGMEFLFDGCIALRKLYLTNFNTKNADLGGIFNRCKSLTNLITNDKRILTVYKRKVKRNKSLQKELNTQQKII